jgi:hypothetical protein
MVSLADQKLSKFFYSKRFLFIVKKCVRAETQLMPLQIIKTFDLLPKNEFDLLPKLTETFDLVVRSCAIRSSDQTPCFLLIIIKLSPFSQKSPE